MHELSVCIALIEQVQQIAKEHRAGSVSRIELSVGPLSGVEPDLLRNAYPLAAAGSIAAAAELVINSAEVSVSCTQCGATSSVPPNRLLCSACGDYRTRVISGDEMILQRLELGDDESSSAADSLST